MMKKIKEISNKEMNTICNKYRNNNCVECPLRRFKDGREKLFCYKQLRANYYADLKYFETLSKETGRNYEDNIKWYTTNQEIVENEEVDL